MSTVQPRVSAQPPRHACRISPSKSFPSNPGTQHSAEPLDVGSAFEGITSRERWKPIQYVTNLISWAQLTQHPLRPRESKTSWKQQYSK